MRYLDVGRSLGKGDLEGEIFGDDAVEIVIEGIVENEAA